MIRQLFREILISISDLRKVIQERSKATHKCTDAVQRHQPPSPEISSIPDIVETIGKDYRKSKGTEESYHQKTFWVSVIGVVVVAAYTTVTFWQGCSSRDLEIIANKTFEAANRPYVGINGVGVNHIGKNASGDIVVSQTRTKETVALNVTPQIKNFGPVSGTNFRGNWRVFIAGVEQPHWNIPNRPTTIFPSQVIYITGQVRPPEYPGVMSGEKVLAFEMTIEYDGPSSHYRECNRFQYDPPTNSFFNLGPICID